MPVIKIWGVSGEPKPILLLLREMVAKACISVQELRLSERQVGVFIVPDVFGSDPSRIAVVEIKDVFEADERTPEVLERLREGVGTTVMGVLGPAWASVEIPPIETVPPISVRVFSH